MYLRVKIIKKWRQDFNIQYNNLLLPLNLCIKFRGNTLALYICFVLSNTLEFYERCKILGTFRGHTVIRSDCRYCDIITGNTHKKHLSHKGYIKRVRTYTCYVPTVHRCISEGYSG